MDPVNVASLIVALIAASAAYASQRAAAKASVDNTKTTSRVDMEKEAYERARAFDTETIRRQDEDLTEIRVENIWLKRENRDLKTENRALRAELFRNINSIRIKKEGPPNERT